MNDLWVHYGYVFIEYASIQIWALIYIFIEYASIHIWAVVYIFMEKVDHLW